MSLARSKIEERNLFNYHDYFLLPDDGKQYQLIEGELFMTPPPGFSLRKREIPPLSFSPKAYAAALELLVRFPYDSLLSYFCIIWSAHCKGENR